MTTRPSDRAIAKVFWDMSGGVGLLDAENVVGAAREIDAKQVEGLRECPFCGCAASFDAPSELYGAPYFTIRCCVAHSKGYDRDAVAAAWNRREGRG